MFSLFRNDLTDGGSRTEVILFLHDMIHIRCQQSVWSGRRQRDVECLPTSAPETGCMSWVGGGAVVTRGGSEGEGVVKLFS